jgi:glycolate oxidase FAD binding subunit
MKATVEQFAGRLEAALGKEAVTTDAATLASYKVDGRSASLLCAPKDPTEMSAALRLCAESEAAVIPWGGGTAMALGNIPRQADVILELKRLNKLLEHDDANLTATAQAGIQVAELQRLLAQRGQFLPLEPPHPDRATIGGTIAANINGPRRMLYGAARDLVIGIKVILADGRRIKAGGKVVKNVAGYDMCKLFVGSLGTLGVITEATFKMAPIPESSATLVAYGPLAQGLQLMDQLMQSTLLPAALALVSADATAIDSGTPAVAVRMEGFDEAVARHVRDAQEIAARLGLRAELFQGSAHDSLWERLRDFAGSAQNLLYRVTVPIASLPEVIEKIDSWSRSEGAARYVAHPGTGTVWLAVEAAPSGAAWFPRLAALAKEQRGHAVMAAAPPELKRGIDVWGSAPESLLLMREIKQQFDPHSLLNPGRFVAAL